ncbi:MAG: PHP domain-containing protein [Candidatus Hadarchaeales archaeon]
MVPKFDFHVHTVYSDGSTPLELVLEEAQSRGLEAVAVTDHGPGLSVGAEAPKFLRLSEEVRKMREENGFKILAGVESNITPVGALDLGKEVLVKLDLVTAGVHYLDSKDCKAQAGEYLRAVRRALCSRSFKVLVHPLYYNKSLLPWIPREEMEEFVEELAEAGVAVELNSKYRAPDKEFLQECLRRGVKLSIGTDAHHAKEIGMVDWQLSLLRRLGARREDLILDSL